MVIFNLIKLWLSNPAPCSGASTVGEKPSCLSLAIFVCPSPCLKSASLVQWISHLHFYGEEMELGFGEWSMALCVLNFFFHLEWLHPNRPSYRNKLVSWTISHKFTRVALRLEVKFHIHGYQNFCLMNRWSHGSFGGSRLYGQFWLDFSFHLIILPNQQPYFLSGARESKKNPELTKCMANNMFPSSQHSRPY